jgi:hypothetical protein
MNKPPSLSCKWLMSGNHEPLLGIQVGSLYDDDHSWNEMIQKIYRSIEQWIPKYLPVFGRVCAAKTYIASKSWYLASVIPPKPKMVSRLNAVLWNFIYNNTCLEEDAPTNRYFARWSAQTLRQPLQDGGLNAQQYDFQLSALHSKWIFSLLNPAITASWTVLPLDNLFKLGLDRSIFIADKSVLTLKTFPSRWKSYFQGWFSPGFHVSSPPLDYECLLNESLWFNRFIKKENGLSFGHYLSHGRFITDDGPRFIADIVVRSTVSPSQLRFLNADELRIRFGSELAKILVDLIQCIPIGWRCIIFRKTREPFQINDWVVTRKSLQNVNTCPTHVSLAKCKLLNSI